MYCKWYECFSISNTRKKKHTKSGEKLLTSNLQIAVCWMFWGWQVRSVDTGRYSRWRDAWIKMKIPPWCQKQLYTREIFTWNLKMMVSKRNLLFQGLLFRFHVKFQGCTPRKFTWNTRMWRFGSGDFPFQTRWFSEIPCEFPRVYVSEFFSCQDW